jgi:PTH1 family peptidyl-tRNA hydrolase
MSNIKVIIGLGNPGPRFFNTRHNIGFQSLDALADESGAQWSEVKNMQQVSIDINGHTVLLVKPTTYMNTSGNIMRHLQRNGVGAENIFVVHDDIDSRFGKIAPKEGGSARGHNGVKSFITAIGKDFKRLRIGVGSPEDSADVPDYVLQKFTPEEQKQLPHVIEEAVSYIESLF